MTPTDKLTVEQAKDLAARELGFNTYHRAYYEIGKTKDKLNYRFRIDELNNRAIELHTASAIAHYKQQVREALPSGQALFNKANEARYFKPESMAYEEGAQWAINKVKELLK